MTRLPGDGISLSPGWLWGRSRVPHDAPQPPNTEEEPRFSASAPCFAYLLRLSPQYTSMVC